MVVTDSKTICLLEAKLGSDFGEDVESGDQLAKEWSDGVAEAARLGRDFALLAVTNHATIPKASIERQLRGVEGVDLSRVFWLSWTNIAQHLARVKGDEVVGRWLDDLLKLLKAMALTFGGFARPDRLEGPGTSELLWAKWVVFGEGEPQASFADAIRLARQCEALPQPTWQFVAEGKHRLVRKTRPQTSDEANFSATVALADDWVKKGGLTWKPQLT